MINHGCSEIVKVGVVSAKWCGENIRDLAIKLRLKTLFVRMEVRTTIRQNPTFDKR
jgi:hypothetical protein